MKRQRGEQEEVIRARPREAQRRGPSGLTLLCDPASSRPTHTRFTSKEGESEIEGERLGLTQRERERERESE